MPARTIRPLALAAVLLVAAPVQAALGAQQGFMAAMHQDLNQVQEKLMGLANAIPESAYGWRPAPGVRSVGEVFLHVAADNYVLPAIMGSPAPAATGVTADYNTAVAYERRQGLTKAQIVADLLASFQHLHRAIGVNTDDNLTTTVDWFGRPATRLNAMVGTVTHLHEHLGQLIAYARANGITPPWSN